MGKVASVEKTMPIVRPMKERPPRPSLQPRFSWKTIGIAAKSMYKLKIG